MFRLTFDGVVKLRQVKAAILANPNKFNMATYCGSPCCVAAWLVQVDTEGRLNQFTDRMVMCYALRILGADEKNMADGLFAPRDFLVFALRHFGQNQGDHLFNTNQAEIAGPYLDDFIARHWDGVVPVPTETKVERLTCTT